MSWQRSFIWLSILALLGGCGSGGTQVAGIDRGGISKSAAVGPVEGFGSIIVNGVDYGTSGATIVVNGQPATEADLQVGYVVAVQADTPEGTTAPVANTVEFDHDIIGPIASVSAADEQIIVLGQTISLDAGTLFGAGIAPASVDGIALLPVAQVLRISGLRDASGVIRATRVELGDAGDGYQLVDFVVGIDIVAQSFMLGALLVDYSGATVTGFMSGEPANGDRVVVKGSALGAAGELLATEVVAQEVSLGVSAGDSVEVEGFIDNFVSAMDFSVNGFAVITDAQTQFEDGVAADLGAGVRVEVEGVVDGAGTILAVKIEFEQEGGDAVWSAVDAVDASAGTLTVLGVAIETNTQTVFEDKSPAELRPFDLGDISPGDDVRVAGVAAAGGGPLVATRVVRSEPLQLLKIQGVAENVSDPTLSILGVTVTTNGGTDIENNFFAIADGRVVEALGNLSGGNFVAEKVEIED